MWLVLAGKMNKFALKHILNYIKTEPLEGTDPPFSILNQSDNKYTASLKYVYLYTYMYNLYITMELEALSS